MTRLHRREFLHRSIGISTAAALGTAGTSVLPVFGAGGQRTHQPGPDRLRRTGAHRGARLIECGARFTHVCDLKEERRESVGGNWARHKGPSPNGCADTQAVFAAADVDGVVVATPDHWHAALTVAACQAGKDVYVEKPHAHSLWESRQVAAAAQKYRVVQIGTQNRSGPVQPSKAREYVQSGKLGDIHLVKVYNLKPGGPFRLGEAGSPPAGFDWDRWLGPAPNRPFHQRSWYTAAGIISGISATGTWPMTASTRWIWP
jgi:predicted dehydrogenase